MTEISVITTTYNGMPYLREAAESILNQTFRDFEYIIVDDGSEDDTATYLSQLADPRVRVIRMPRIGRGTALNVALKACQSDWIVNLDADDVSSPLRLELQYQWTQNYPDFDVISCTCSLDPNGLHVNGKPLGSIRLVDPKEFIRRTPIAHSAVIMRRKTLLEVGGYDEKRKNLFDFDLWIRLAARGFHFGRVPLPLVFKRIHPRQAFEAHRRIPYLWSGLKGRMRAFSLFSKNPFDLIYPVAGFLYGLFPVTVRRKISPLSCEFV